MINAFLTSSGSGDILGGVTSFVGEATSWIGSFADAITSNTFLTLAVITLPIAGFGIGAIKRLLRFRA